MWPPSHALIKLQAVLILAGKQWGHPLAAFVNRDERISAVVPA